MKIVQQTQHTDRRLRNARSGERGIDTDLAVTFLKASGHPGRLAILNYLSTGEKSVGMLETLLNTRQAAVSQLLARLRQEGLVQCRREGKTIYYRLGDARVERFVSAVQEVFRS